MGLTIHYELTAPGDTGEEQAKTLVESMHRVARRFHRRGAADQVLPITSDEQTLKRFASAWVTYAVPDEPKIKRSVEITPFGGWLFVVNIGEDCEPLHLGLCRYPEGTLVRWRWDKVQTGWGQKWRLEGFSKTQYASLHGWEHFRRCHTAVVDLLVALRPLGFRVQIFDEGEYWPRHSLTKLRRNIDEMNGVVAAAAGALKDMDEAINGRSAMESPVFRHRQYERLEAEGAAATAPLIRLLNTARKRQRTAAG